MLCEKCGKNEATFYYKENVNGQVRSYHLCRDCAMKLQKSGEIQTAMTEDPISKMFGLLSGEDPMDMDDLFGKLIGSPQKMQPQEKGKTCPLCGSSFLDLAKTGKVGCPQCYETFALELTPSIQRIHGRTAHTGQAPAKFREEIEKKQKIAALEAELKEAIQNENYERAAQIRDTVKDLRNA